MRCFAALRTTAFSSLSSCDDSAVATDRHLFLDAVLGRPARPLAVGAAAQVLDVAVVQRLELCLRAGAAGRRRCRGLVLRRRGAGDAGKGQDQKASHEASLPFKTWPERVPVAS